MFDDYARYTANTGIGVVNTANTALDGSGTLGTILTAASNGTLIKSVTVKTTATIINQGMVRLFIYDGANTRLLMEIDTPPAGRTGIWPSWTWTINLNYFLNAGDVLKASTQESKVYNVIAEGLDISYP